MSPAEDPLDDDVELERLARVDEIVTAALARSRAGHAIDVAKIVAEHPDLEDALRPALGGIARLEVAAAQVDAEFEDRFGEVPEMFGPYRVVRELGRGGMGVVYEGHDTALDRPVAIKLLPRSASRNRDYVDRFRREAHAAGKLEHPHLVPIYGVDEQDGQHYIAMKLIDGCGLDDAEVWSYLDPGDVEDAAGPARYHAAARVALACADALAHAHDQGVLHRDIKPSNILVDPRGHPWITDFGLAKLDESEDLTREGDFVGTLRYTAPEQFQGEAEARSDVYALGLVLYELAVGQRALQARGRSELVHELLYVQPTPPSRVRADMPQDLSRIVMKASAKLADQRYSSAGEMAHDLRAFLGGRPIAAREPSALYLARLAIQRNRALFVAAVGFVALLTVGAILYGLQMQRAATAKEALGYRANLAAASTSILNGDTAMARLRLDACPEALRGWEWRHLNASVDQSLRDVVLVTDPIETIRAVGDEMVIVHRRGAKVLSAAGIESVAFPNAEAVYAETIDALRGPDRWYIHQYLEGIWSIPFDRLDPSDGQSVEQAPSVKDGLTKRLQFKGHSDLVSFGERADRMAFASTNGSLYVVDLKEMRVTRSAPHGMRHVADVVVDANVTTAYLVALDGRMVEWDLMTLESVEHFRGSAPLRRVACTRDQTRFAVGGDDRSVLVLDASTDEVLHHLIGHTGAVMALAFSRDGRLLASAGEDKVIHLWDVEAGTLLQTMRGHSSLIRTLAFSTDGTRLFSGSLGGLVKEWVVGVTGGRERIREQHGDIVGLGFSSTGDRFATGARDGTVRIYDSASLRLDALLIGHAAELNGVLWHANDTRLCTVDRNGYVLDWDVELEEPAWSTRLPGVAAEPVSSDDGASLLLGSSGGALVKLDAMNGEVLAENRAVEIDVTSLAHDVKRGRLLVGAEDGVLRVFDPVALTEQAQYGRHDLCVTAIALSSDGETTVTSSMDRSIMLSNDTGLDGGLRSVLGAREHSWHSDALDDVEFSPDGRLLAAASHNWLVRVADPKTGEIILDLKGHEDWVRRLAFSADGRTLVSVDSRANVRVWDDRTTLEREESRAKRMSLEAKGLAWVRVELGRELVDIDDLDEGIALTRDCLDGPEDLRRAARGALHQERSRRLVEVFERRLARSWSVDEARRVRTWLAALERRRPFNQSTYRLKALSSVVAGKLEDARRDLAQAAALGSPEAPRSPMTRALEAVLGFRNGLADAAAPRRGAPREGAADAASGSLTERRSAALILERRER